MNKCFSVLSSKLIFTNPHWDYYKDEYILPNQKVGDYHFVKSSGSVMIIPRTKNGKFILTKQFRYLNKRDSIEFPGGGANLDMLAETEAARELSEETGFKADSLVKIAEFNPCKGLTDEICNVFVADGLSPIVAAKDESEEIETLELSGEEINDLIKNRTIWDGMTLAAWSIYLINNGIMK
jgi:ADP-ribose pyrophosphatase